MPWQEPLDTIRNIGGTGVEPQKEKLTEEERRRKEFWGNACFAAMLRGVAKRNKKKPYDLDMASGDRLVFP